MKLPVRVDNYYLSETEDTYLTYCIVDADEELIALQIMEKEDAEALVRAMNAHKAFLKAAKEILNKNMIIIDTFGNKATFAYEHLRKGLNLSIE